VAARRREGKMSLRGRTIFIISADLAVMQGCIQELDASGGHCLIRTASSLEQARREIHRTTPSVAFLDESAVDASNGGESLESAVALLTETSPVVVAAAPEKQASLVFLITSGAVDFVGGTAKCSADLGAASPLRKDFVFNSPLIAVLDNNLYYQFGVLARVYDWKSGGKQTFPVLIPQDMVPGSISVESLGQQQAGNGKYEAVRVSSPDLEIMVYVDGNHRMMRLEVPSSNVAIERE